MPQESCLLRDVFGAVSSLLSPYRDTTYTSFNLQKEDFLYTTKKLKFSSFGDRRPPRYAQPERRYFLLPYVQELVTYFSYFLGHVVIRKKEKQRKA